MKLYLDCSSLTNEHVSGIGIYNKNLFLEAQKTLNDNIVPVLKLNRFSKKQIVEKHLQSQVSFLPPVIINKNVLYHGTDHKLNAQSFGPRVVTIHDMQPFVDKWLDPLFAKRRRLIIDKTLRSSVDRIIAVSEFTRGEILKDYPKLEAKIDVVYHGCDFNVLSTVGENRLISLINGRPFLLFIGNIEERKNLINQLRAFAILKERMPELIFIMAGNPGFNYQSIYQEIQASSVKDDIYLTGYLNETEKRFALEHTRCLMFASWYEGFGIPVIEALAYNTNVLISDNGALNEIAGRFCHQANPSSIDDIIAKTQLIMSSGNKLKIDLNEWKSKWSWEKAASDTIKVYQKTYM